MLPSTIVILAPSPLYQVALIVMGRRAVIVEVPIADAEHYLACCAERMGR